MVHYDIFVVIYRREKSQIILNAVVTPLIFLNGPRYTIVSHLKMKGVML